MEDKITALLVDDEENSRIVLRSLLKDFFPEIVIIGEASNVDDAFKIVEREKPQVVFLDIQMPKSSGFTLLKKYKEVPFEVVFVTSYDSYAITAIKFSALDYLLKPVEISELKVAMDKLTKSVKNKTSKDIQIINLLQSIGDAGKDRKLAVHFGGSVKLLGANEIAYIESDGSYCTITTYSGEHYTIFKYLKDFEDYFGETSDFVRTHKNTMINSKHIKEYSKGEPCIIEMCDGKTIEVARRKKQEVLEKLKSK